MFKITLVLGLYHLSKHDQVCH